MKKSHDYDNTFKTLKNKHAKLFISVINEAFNKCYPLDSKVEIVSSEGAFINKIQSTDVNKIEIRQNDFLLRINDDYYLIESQTTDDNTMALRLAEYTFLAARSSATYDQERILIPMPNYTVLYVKSTDRTPETTTITYLFPDGSTHDYIAHNVFMKSFSKEDIFKKKLYALIPFYFARYEKELSTATDYQGAIEDLQFFRNMMDKLLSSKELDGCEAADIADCVKDILRHITDGNNIEQEVVSIMGGEIYELYSERLVRETTEKVTAEVTDKVTAEYEEKIEELKERIAELEKCQSQ